MICLKNNKDHIKDQVFCKNEKNFEFSSPYITCNTIWIPAALSTFGGKNSIIFFFQKKSCPESDTFCFLYLPISKRLYIQL